MRILITGSTGFIGGSVGRFAAAAGHEVVGIARRSQPDPGWPGGHVSADVAQADLAEVVRDAAPDVVFHGAGTASVAASFAAPLDDLRAATMTWANLLDGVRRSGLRPRVVFPSSAAVYGNPARLPISEDVPAIPISPYGFHKLACEWVGREYAACFGLDVLIVRVFSVIGAAQRRLLVWDTYRKLLDARPDLSVDGTGEESRDYLDVRDLAAAVIALGGAPPPAAGAAGFELVNLAAGVETRVAEMVDQVRSLTAPGKAVVFTGHRRPGDPAHWRADVDALRLRLPGWRPRPIAAAVSDCIAAWEGERLRPAVDSPRGLADN